jgi:hypothetical protein
MYVCFGKMALSQMKEPHKKNYSLLLTSLVTLVLHVAFWDRFYKTALRP